jgi:flagellar motor switch protein FliN
LSRETQPVELGSPGSVLVAAPAAAPADPGPFDTLPRLELKQVRVERSLLPWTAGNRLPPELRWLEDWTGTEIAVLRPEVLWRASALTRSGLVAQLVAPELATRMAVGVEIPLAHAIVDRLLGFDRSLGESRLQLTPVEWGIWTFLILRVLEALEPAAGGDQPPQSGDPGLLGLAGLALDRVGPDPFDPEGLGSIVTIRWPARVGSVTGAVRLWLAESVVRSWIAASARRRHGDERPGHPTLDPDLPVTPRAASCVSPRELACLWRAEAGHVFLPQGLRRLRTGSVLPFRSGGLSGTPASPTGQLALVLDLNGQATRLRIPARPIGDSGARLLEVEARPITEPQACDPTVGTLKERPAMSQTNPPGERHGSAAASPDVPVTLTVELGRVNLTLAQLADLKAGDVVELSRHSRAPVELTSGGRLVARGELILIDTELGVRVTGVFL